MKKILIALVLGLTMIALIAMPALAATQKVELTRYHYEAGYATFTTDQGDGALVVGITVKNATPNSKYAVYLCEGAVNSTLGYLKTNSKGNWGGQNEQYEFVKVLPVGEHTVQLVLQRIIGGVPESETRNWIRSPRVTFNITRN